MRERSRSRGIGVEATLRLNARDPLVGVWNGYIPIYTGCISSLWISPPPLTLDTLHRTEPTYSEPRYVAASRFSPRHFSRYPLRIYIYTLSLSLFLYASFSLSPFCFRNENLDILFRLAFILRFEGRDRNLLWRRSADLRIRISIEKYLPRGR